MEKPINVLLVDDHHLLLTALTTLLKPYPDIEVVGHATNGADAITTYQALRPDVTLMDIQMVGMDGLEATQNITNLDPSARVLILSAYEDDIFPIRLLKVGALGYLTKGCQSIELVKGIRSVYHYKRYIPPLIAQKMALSRFPFDQDTPFDILSQRELQVVLMITTDALKVSQIAEQLDLNPKTINTYRYRIFEKLGVNNDVQLTHMAWHFNLIHPI